jgi:Flp pilus assembly protein TadD
VLRTAIATSLQDAGLRHTLALTLTRQKRPDDALAEFRVATELEPDRLRYAYVFAVALHSAGRFDESIKVLKESLTRHPGDRDTLLALVTFNRDAGDIGAALQYAEQLTRLAPNDRELNNLIENLRARLGK